MLDLEGAQIGSLQWALTKLTPLSARRSKFGVGTWGLPAGCKGMSLRSSTMIKRTLGREGGWAVTQYWEAEKRKKDATPRHQRQDRRAEQTRMEGRSEGMGKYGAASGFESMGLLVMGSGNRISSRPWSRLIDDQMQGARSPLQGRKTNSLELMRLRHTTCKPRSWAILVATASSLASG